MKGTTEHFEEKEVIKNRSDDTGSYHITEQSEICVDSSGKENPGNSDLTFTHLRRFNIWNISVPTNAITPIFFIQSFNS